MIKLLNGSGSIVELTGTPDSAPALDRYQGFREVIKEYPAMRIIASQSGDFTRAKGHEVMASLLKQYGTEINALYAHNDDMAIGAIKAIEEYGLRPGVDIQIVSIDAIRDAFKAMIDGKLNATVECNPLLGPKFFELALMVANGVPVPKWIPSTESVSLPRQCRRDPADAQVLGGFYNWYTLRRQHPQFEMDPGFARNALPRTLSSSPHSPGSSKPSSLIPPTLPFPAR